MLPGPNRAELPIVFEVVLPRQRPSPEPRAERVPQLVARPLDVDGLLVLEAEVVQIDVALGQQRQAGGRRTRPRKSGPGRDIVEDAGLVENRLRPPAVHLPVPRVQQEPRGVERQAQVRAVTHVDEPPRAVLQLLPTEPGGERVLLAAERQDEVREGLMNAEGVSVDVGRGPPMRPSSRPVTICPKKRK